MHTKLVHLYDRAHYYVTWYMIHVETCPGVAIKCPCYLYIFATYNVSYSQPNASLLSYYCCWESYGDSGHKGEACLSINCSTFQVLLPCSLMLTLSGPIDKPGMDINIAIDPISLTISPAIVRLIIHAAKTLTPQKVWAHFNVRTVQDGM